MFHEIDQNPVDVERRELRILNAFAVELIRIPSERELARYAACEVVSALGFEDCAFYFLNARGTSLKQVAFSRRAAGSPPASARAVNDIPFGRGVVGRVVQTGRPVIIGDLSRDPDYLPDGVAMQSAICVPIRSGAAILGAVICRDPLARAFGPSHLELLETVAALVGAKLDLFRQTDALEESERDAKDILDNLKDVYYRTGADGRIELVSASATELLGYSNEELIGMECRLLYAEHQDEDRFIEEIRRQGGTVSGYEMRLRNKDDRTIWCSVSARYRLGGDGEVIGIEGIVCDIDQRKSLEQTLSRALAQAEMANRSKTSFLAAMSHELRTPLNAILGFAEVINSEFLGPIGNPKYAEYISDISTSGRFLLDLINDLLDISKIESGAYQVDLTTIEAGAVASECLEMMRAKAAQCGIICSLQGAELPVTVRADRRALMQVLLNLLSNAIKFTPHGGSVTIVLSHTGSGMAEITVQDTGCGIHDSMLPNLFEPFSTTANDPRIAQEGTGLGLAISKSLVTMMGGTIAAESRRGAGTIMRVSLSTPETLDVAESA